MSCYEHYTPNGSRLWFRRVPRSLKPVLNSQYPRFDHCLRFYELYAEAAGLDVKKASFNKLADGSISYVDTYKNKSKRQSRKGKEVGLNNANTVRKSPKVVNCKCSSVKCGCDASLRCKIYRFFEGHNHKLVSEANKSSLHIKRKMEYFDMNFVQDLRSKSNIGPMLAHHINCDISCGYNMIFVPIIGIDNHKKLVIFGAALLSSETIESYKWFIDCFLETFSTEPGLVTTDQDLAVLVAVYEKFKTAKHRLCMWHISQKLKDKVSYELYNNKDFRNRMNYIFWNKHMFEKTFERRWKLLIDDFCLHGENWFNDMYAKKEIFDAAMDKQRHNNRLIEFEIENKSIKCVTDRLIELKAIEVYTPTFFLLVQNEVFKTKEMCAQKSCTSDGEYDVKKKCVVQNDKATLQILSDKFNMFMQDFVASIPDELSSCTKIQISKNVLGFSKPKNVTIHPLNNIRNKGQRNRKRYSSARENAVKNSSVNRRRCQRCQGVGHNVCTCAADLDSDLNSDVDEDVHSEEGEDNDE
ncbi:uncharacterized protein [Rutidosis leptorrhynchoides]|uniref:uncharacterized protein n=1 Tax=Rutidosis leptorrhynchoides TaxID=125765 RepID=UPI003A9A1C97